MNSGYSLAISLPERSRIKIWSSSKLRFTKKVIVYLELIDLMSLFLFRVPCAEDLACHISAPIVQPLGSIWDFIPINKNCIIVKMKKT